MANLSPEQQQSRSLWAQQYVQERAVLLAAIAYRCHSKYDRGFLLIQPRPDCLNKVSWVTQSSQTYQKMPFVPAFLEAVASYDPAITVVIVFSFLQWDGQNDEYCIIGKPPLPPPVCDAAVQERPTEFEVIAIDWE